MRNTARTPLTALVATPCRPATVLVTNPPQNVALDKLATAPSAEEAGTGPGGTEERDLSGSGRYIRIYGTERNTVWGYSLFEFEVYGTAAGAPGDMNGDGNVDKQDYEAFAACPSVPASPHQAVATGPI